MKSKSLISSILTMMVILAMVTTNNNNMSMAFQNPTFGIGRGTHSIIQPATSKSRTTTTTTSLCGFMDEMQNFMKRFTSKATASHILIKGGAEAENKLEDLKVEIGDSPIKFAEYAAQYSACPSASSGGNLGEFGPGQMVKEFDTVVFNEPVGVVHGPIKTQFGYHLILIQSRTE